MIVIIWDGSKRNDAVNEGLESWASLLKTTSDGVRNNPYISKLSQSVEKALAAQRAREAMTPGAQYADFRGSWEGKEYSLSDFVNQGKYVLVDFWASWCGRRGFALYKDWIIVTLSIFY